MVPETFRRLPPKHQLRVAWASRVACLALGLVGATHAQQTSARLVKVKQATQITDAVMISNVAVAGRTIECGLWIKPNTVHLTILSCWAKSRRRVRWRWRGRRL
jgi:hypothetical protein